MSKSQKNQNTNNKTINDDKLIKVSHIEAQLILMVKQAGTRHKILMESHIPSNNIREELVYQTNLDQVILKDSQRLSNINDIVVRKQADLLKISKLNNVSKLRK